MFWPRCIAAIRGFAEARTIDTRELLVLLPLAQHVALAEAAWAAVPSAAWMPRFETTLTLARRLAPRPPELPGAMAFDPVVGALRLATLLRSRLPAAAQSDRLRFEALVQRVLAAAQALAQARSALPPVDRVAWSEQAQTLSQGIGGAGADERALLRLALAWAGTAEATTADLLHECAPGARVVVSCGAADRAVAAWVAKRAQATSPTLWIEADLPLDEVSAWPLVTTRTLTPCRDFEDEAQRTAAQVLDHVARGDVPVALVALDRVLLRRVRALLERHDVRLADESGWKLSTTRAGACVVGLLRAAQPTASTDELLDWLACVPAPTLSAASLGALDADWRRRGFTAVRQVDAQHMDAPMRNEWDRWLHLAEPLQRTRRAPLAAWLSRLDEALERATVIDSLMPDAAGAQVLSALRMRREDGSSWPADLADIEFDLPDFTSWVQSVLEAVAFAPPTGGLAEAQVVITPLTRVALRPFAAVVCPGADAAHLGVAGPPGLISESMAAALGVPTSVQRAEDEGRAFAQLLRVPRCAFLHRSTDGKEPLLAGTPLLQMAWAAERAGQPLLAAHDARGVLLVRAEAGAPPAPSAPPLVPEDVHATAYEALRICPYRFFALRMLRLREADELDDALDARDHGSWLHAVLKAFHEQRDPGCPEHDAAHLAEAARAALNELARDDEDFLPHEVSFEAFAPRYLEWLHAQEAEGWQARHHELSLKVAPVTAVAPAVVLPGRYGVLDRVDVQATAGGERWRVIDYKASTVDRVKKRVKPAFEDTQLAFYAGLLVDALGEPSGGVGAAYLAIEAGKKPVLVEHPQVDATAAALIEGLASDFGRLHAGASLPALGEGASCEHCAARGLCRRDFWSDARPPGSPAMAAEPGG